MAKFKVGDKVRPVDGLTYDETGIIEEFLQHCNVFTVEDILTYSDCTNYSLVENCSEWQEDWLELVEEAEQHPCIKDSGERTEYSTGAVRDCKEGKGRCDLMPLDVVAELLKSEPIRCICGAKQDGVAGLYDAIASFGAETGKSSAKMLLEVSKHFEEGAKKYGENNWQKGIPVHSYIDSAVRHYLKYTAGWKDEPHDRAFVWNLMCCIWTTEHHPELDDFTLKGAAAHEVPSEKENS